LLKNKSASIPKQSSPIPNRLSQKRFYIWINNKNAMKKTLLLFLFPVAIGTLRAQTTAFCDADFSCNVPLITFETQSMAGWGDSAVNIRISNNSGINYAYPMAKLFAVTPLPPGMTMNSNFNWWMPFASSWNHGDTALFPCGYEVTQPIPANYTVTFRLWLRPNDTAVGYDSCVFSQDFTLNLNPLTGIDENSAMISAVTIYPNPATDLVTISVAYDRVKPATAVVTNSCGQQMLNVALVNDRMDVSELPTGMYIVHLFDNDGKPAGSVKLVR
jgi:hypothetical protein